jgi:hypothetical protein
MGWSGYLMAGTRSGPGFEWPKPGPDRTGPITTLLKVTPLAEQRERGSQCNNCHLQVVGLHRDGVWGLTVRVGAHNHESTSLDAHSSVRHLDTDQQKSIARLTNVGVRLGTIEFHLQQS